MNGRINSGDYAVVGDEVVRPVVFPPEVPVTVAVVPHLEVVEERLNEAGDVGTTWTAGVDATASAIDEIYVVNEIARAKGRPASVNVGVAVGVKARRVGVLVGVEGQVAKAEVSGSRTWRSDVGREPLRGQQVRRARLRLELDRGTGASRTDPRDVGVMHLRPGDIGTGGEVERAAEAELVNASGQGANGASDSLVAGNGRDVDNRVSNGGGGDEVDIRPAGDAGASHYRTQCNL